MSRNRSGADQLIVKAIEITSKLLNSNAGNSDSFKRKLDQMKSEAETRKMSKWNILRRLLSLIENIVR